MSRPLRFLLWLILALLPSIAQAGSVNLAWDASVTSGVTGYRLHYGTVTGTYTVQQDAGNQLTGTLANLTAGQQYFIAATAYDATGQQSPFSNEVSHTVPLSNVPVANFAVSPTAGVVPLLVSFTDTSIGNVTSWAWDFGDSATSTAKNPTHTYASAGTYTVSLTVSGPDGTNALTRTNVLTASAPSGGGGLVAAYSFDSGSGATLTDTSGLGNHGTIAGATWTTVGRYGQALTFDGVNDWVTIADAPSLDLTTGMTLEAWVYPSAQSGWKTVIQKEVAAYFMHASTDDPLFPAAGGTVQGAVNAIYGGNALPVNTWSHLAATYDGTTFRLYVGGTIVSSLVAAGSMETNANPLRLGGNSTYGNEYFVGRIDEIRIYNRALTAAEIQTDMQTPVTPPPPAPPLAPTQLRVTPGQ